VTDTPNPAEGRMSGLDRFRPRREANPAEIPDKVSSRIQRGRQAMKRDSLKRRLCRKFLRSETYWFINDKQRMNFQQNLPAAAPGTGKPPQRIRNTYNFIKPIVMGKVSAGSQRIPGYEVVPSGTDSKRIHAARLSEKVAIFGYDKWNIRKVTVKVMTLAIGGGGEGFAMPYFDPNVGPFLIPAPGPDGMPSGPPIGQGEIKIKVYDGNQVFWESGMDFLDSSWWGVESAEPIDETMNLPGFFGEKLTPDASTSDIPNDRDADNQLCIVTRYYERPCPDYPNGRVLTMAAGRVIVDYRRVDPDALDPCEPWPLVGPDGQAVDEPVLHRLTWDIDVERDRPLGLTWELIDPQRTLQDIWNKLLELKNRAMNARLLAERGSNVTPLTDEPGQVVEYSARGNAQNVPKFEDVSNAIAIAQPLMNMFELMRDTMRELGYDTQLEAQANVAAKTLNAVIEQNAAKWQSFLGDAADWHSRLMRHCLTLVSHHYSEKRLLGIRGPFGPESIADFTGSDLMSEVDIRVLPGSLDYLTKDQVTQRVLAYADRGWITPQQAMVAIASGNADLLIQPLELDIARIDRIIQKIMDGSVMEMPTRIEIIDVPVLDEGGQPVIDPATGAPQTKQEPQEVPSWMPMDMVDDLSVWRSRLGDFMKTDTYTDLPREGQETAKLILQAIDDLQRKQAQRQVDQQNAMAEKLGMSNAAKPQQAKALPDQSQPAGEQPTAQPVPA
jgi:hypothetical protein